MDKRKKQMIYDLLMHLPISQRTLKIIILGDTWLEMQRHPARVWKSSLIFHERLSRALVTNMENYCYFIYEKQCWNNLQIFLKMSTKTINLHLVYSNNANILNENQCNSIYTGSPMHLARYSGALFSLKKKSGDGSGRSHFLQIQFSS